MKIKIITGDIFTLKADALVFPANKKAVIGGSLDGQIYERAGAEDLLSARNECGELHSGESCITESYGLKESYNWLIHTSTPVYQHAHPTNTMHKLKKCYLSSLKTADEKGLKSVVFALLGAGASGFSQKKAVEAAESAIERYKNENPESTIESIIIVKYENESQYQLLIECNRKLKGVEKLLSQIDGLEDYVQPDSEICKIIKKVAEKLQYETADKITKWYQEFQAEISSEEAEEVRNKIYDQILEDNKKDKQYELADDINESAGLISHIYRISKKEKIHRHAKAFWKKKQNVLKLGIALELDSRNMCRLLWSRGHSFPSDRFDYDILNIYIPICDYEEMKRAWSQEFNEQFGNEEYEDKGEER